MDGIMDKYWELPLEGCVHKLLPFYIYGIERSLYSPLRALVHMPLSGFDMWMTCCSLLHFWTIDKIFFLY